VSEEWGPWIEHDGGPVPHLSGAWVHAKCETHQGEIVEREGRISDGFGQSWVWENFGKIGRHNGKLVVWTKVVEFRIRKPKGLTILEGILAEEPDLPPRVDA